VSADGLSMYRIAPVSSPQDVAPSLSVSAPVKMDGNRSGGNSWERCATFNTASAPLKIEQLQPSARESTSPSAPVPSPAPELAPAPDPEKPKLLEAPTLSRDALGGKLMEVDALLRHKFATRQELESVQQAVDTGLSLLSELPALAAQAHLIEGALFQELLQRLANAPPVQQSSAQPAHPVPPLPGGLVSRTPIPGAERETWKASQSIQGLYGGDQAQLMLLLDRVGALRSLLRIKIEDNRDLDLARRALGDVQCAIENLWWYASEMGASAEDSVDPEDKLGVTTLLQELRGEA